MDDALRERLQNLIRTHAVMFDRLLFEQPVTSAVVAELLRDVGKTYIELSEALQRNDRDMSRSGR
jgi:hypothetical protein